jgi:integrase
MQTGVGPVTANKYFETARAFLNWGVKRKRFPSNPLKDVEKIAEENDIRHARRALSVEELTWLLKSVPGRRAFIYRVALLTGIRRQELRDLRWQDIHADCTVPFIRLRAEAAKARRAEDLPLHPDLLAGFNVLRAAANSEADRIFKAIPKPQTVKADFATGRAAWLEAEKDAAVRKKMEETDFLKDVDVTGHRIDLHSLRHTYGTMLSKAGVAPRVAMSFMRHSIELTMKTYTDPRIFDTPGAVGLLSLPNVPSASPELQRATGTDATLAFPDGGGDGNGSGIKRGIDSLPARAFPGTVMQIDTNGKNTKTPLAEGVLHTSAHVGAARKLGKNMRARGVEPPSPYGH